MNINLRISKKIFNDIYYPQLFNYDTRINVYYGGGGSGKSHFVVQKMVLKALKFEKRRILVIRKVGKDIRESIFALTKRVISDWGLYDKCKVNKSDLTIELPNKSVFIFKGLDDEERIKSIDNIDDIVVEECTELDGHEFTQLNLRLRSKNPYNQIHVMFNPVSKDNWVFKEWFSEETEQPRNDLKNTIVIKSTYKDNKFLPQSYTDYLEGLKNVKPIYYRIYALGEFATLDKLIYTNWEECNFNWREKLREDRSLRAIFGLDFGYTNDPSAFICALLDDRKKEIWIFEEMYEKGLTNDDLAEKIINMGYKKERIVCDGAEPKSVAELNKYGLNRAIAYKKSKGSILQGIQLVQQYKIYVNGECKNTINELKNYTWKKDKSTNMYVNVPIDKYNHLLDALRYTISENVENKVPYLVVGKYC